MGYLEIVVQSSCIITSTMCYKSAFILLLGLIFVNSSIVKRDVNANDELSNVLSEYGMGNLYDVLKKHSISVDNVWVVGEDKLREWNVSENDVLTYKRKTQEYQENKENTEGGQYSKLVAFLISFFAGGLGADWFYLSAGSAAYIVAGIFKLITIGGFGIWWLVDWIHILADTFPDGNGISLRNDM